MKRRVVITGIGAVTPIGHGADGLWQGVRSERSAVQAVDRFDAGQFNSRVAAQVNDFAPERYIDPKRLKRLDRFSAMAVAAGRMALEDACIVPSELDRERTGVTLGSALGGVAHAESEMLKYLDGGLRAVNPALALSVFGGAGSCNIAIEFGFTGYTTANADSCASGPIALGNAMNAIRRGDADVMLAGAAEAPLSPLTFGAFALIRAMSTRNDDPAHACRPFDRDRDGFVMAEGAAILILEALEHAEDRGAHVYAELCGFGLSNDGYHMTAPRPDGRQAAKAMALALADAGVSADEIDYVNAHGSSTSLNDSMETKAVRSIFGNRAVKVPVSATKAMHGHSLGASGAIEAAICALAIENRWIPPTLNLDNPGEDFDLDYVPGHGRSADLRYVLSNSFGFGGINAAIVLASPDRDA